MNIGRLLLHAMVVGMLITYCLSERNSQRRIRHGNKKLARYNAAEMKPVKETSRGRKGRRRHRQRKKMTRELESVLRNCNEILLESTHNSTSKSKWTPEKCITTLSNNYNKLCDNKRKKKSVGRKCDLFRRRIGDVMPLARLKGPPRSGDRKQMPNSADKAYCYTKRGMKPYNRLTHACCNGVRRRRKNHEICCQDKLVQSSVFICCDYQIRQREGADTECCGTHAINSSLLSCCGQEPYDHTDTSLVCCGNETMNLTTHFCYENTSFDRLDRYPKGDHKQDPKGDPKGDDKSDSLYTMIVYTTESTATDPTNDTYTEETDSNDDGLNDEVSPPDQSPDTSTSHGSLGYIIPGSAAGIIVLLVIIITIIVMIWKRRARNNLKASHSVQNSGYDSTPENNRRQHANSVPHPTISENNHRQQANSVPQPTISDFFPTSIEVLPVYGPSLNSGGESGYWSDMHSSNKIDKPEDGTKQKNQAHAEQNAQTNKKRQSLKSVHSLEQRLEIDLSYLDEIKKATIIPEKNVTKYLSKDSMTQTCPINDTKSNIPDSFGNSFQFSEIMSKNRKTVKLDDSDVTMVLPEKDLKEHTIECHASSFSNIPAIMRKLGVSASEAIASPMIEYFLRGIKMLQGYAIIEMPYIGKLEHLKVLRMLSDQGENELAKKFEVPRRDVLDDTLDTFYIPDTHRKLVRIFTRVFSWYGCLTCKDGGHRVSLKADLYGGIKKNESRVDLVLYILDDLHQMKDYYKEIKDHEAQQGRRYLERGRMIDLPQHVQPSDQLVMYINLQEENMWRHVADAQNPGFEANRQTVPFDQVMQCERMTGTPFKCVWYLENIPGTTPDKIKCFLYIDFCSSTPPEGADSSKSTVATRVLVDETLKCHQVQDSVKTIMGVTGEQDEETLSSLNRQLKGSLDIPETCLENILHDLQSRLPRDVFVERIVTAYTNCNLHKELQCLKAIDIIPDSVKILPPQKCGQVRRELDHTPPSSYDKLCRCSNGGERQHGLIDPEPELASLSLGGSYEKRINAENV